MKRFSQFLFIIATGVAVIAACAKETDLTSNSGTNPKDGFIMRVKAGGAGTKTVISDPGTGSSYGINWSAGDKLGVFEVANGEVQAMAESEELASGGETATFQFSLTGSPSGPYKYAFVYPSSALENTAPNEYSIWIKQNQTFAPNSFDPAADAMISELKEFNTRPGKVNAKFARIGATARMVIQAPTTTETIQSITFSTTEGNISGYYTMNPSTGEVSEDFALGNNSVILTPASSTTYSGDIVVWFRLGTITLTNDFSVEVRTNLKSYKKDVDLATAGKSLTFTDGKMTKFSVDMESATKIVNDGDYLILAGINGGTFAMKGEANNTRIGDFQINNTGEIPTSYAGPNTSIIWTITHIGSSYTIKNGDNYVGWENESGNAAKLVPEANYNDSECLMNIEDLGNGTYHISVAANDTRILARNSTASNHYFAFYGDTQAKDLILVPATYMEQVATPTFDPAEGEVSSGTEVAISCATGGATIHYTVDGTDPTSSSATYSSPITITATTTIKAIAVKDGMADSEIASATYTLQGAVIEWELVSDFSTIANGGEYIFVNVQNSTSYYMNTATCNQGGGTGCVALTILPTGSGFVASDNMILVLSGSADGFVASNKEGKQLKIGATNNGLAMNADSGTSLSFYTDDNVSGYTLKGNDTNAVIRYIGMNGTTNFRCYNSVNTNVTTGEYVWYHHIGTGSNVTWNLESISITTPPTTTTYTAGQSFDPAGMVVTGHFVDADDNTNTKDEAVTGYTITPDGALSTSDDHVTITYQGKSVDQAIAVNPAPAGNDGSLEHPYTASEARALALNGDTGSYYISGIVTKIQNQYSASYGTANFWIDENGTDQTVFEGYKIKYFGDVNWVEGNAEIALSDEVVIYGTLTVYTNNNNSTPETSSGYLVSLNGKTKGLTLAAPTVTTNDSSKQITVAWTAATGTESAVSYVINCGTQSYNASDAGSHTFTMADYGTYNVSVEATASDAVAATINTSATLTDPSSATPYYVKVTDLSTLSANDKVIVINMNHKALPAFTGTGTISESDISSAYDSTNDRFSVTSDVANCAITLKAPTTTVNDKTVFKLFMSNNNYITKTGTGGTGFNPATTSTDVGGDWTLSMDSNGRVNVKNNYSGSTRCLIWRAGSTNKFGAYASSNVNDSEYYNVYLYKLAN